MLSGDYLDILVSQFGVVCLKMSVNAGNEMRYR